MTAAKTKRITLREITEDTLRPVLQLNVAESQKRFVATNAVSVAQAHFSKNAWFRAIYAGKTPVGFVMLYIDRKEPAYAVWRFMIDRKHQKKRYGTRAMRQVIKFVKTLPGAKELCLSHCPGKGNPGAFYMKLGFLHTGEWSEGERVMKLAL
jgi:diamine N-acetyltransferase